LVVGQGQGFSGRRPHWYSSEAQGARRERHRRYARAGEIHYLRTVAGVIRNGDRTLGHSDYAGSKLHIDRATSLRSQRTRTVVGLGIVATSDNAIYGQVAETAIFQGHNLGGARCDGMTDNLG